MRYCETYEILIFKKLLPAPYHPRDFRYRCFPKRKLGHLTAFSPCYHQVKYGEILRNPENLHPYRRSQCLRFRGASLHRISSFFPRTCAAWWLIGRFVAFRPKDRGFGSNSSRHVETLDESCTRCCLWRFGVLTLTQYPCCVVSAPEQ